VRAESARRERSRMLDSAYISPNVIRRIEKPKLVFIPKFEVGSKC
jgi:hypothetical protein